MLTLSSAWFLLSHSKETRLSLSFVQPPTFVFASLGVPWHHPENVIKHMDAHTRDVPFAYVIHSQNIAQGTSCGQQSNFFLLSTNPTEWLISVASWKPPPNTLVGIWAVRSFKAVFSKFQCVYKRPGDLVTMQILGLRRDSAHLTSTQLMSMLVGGPV